MIKAYFSVPAKQRGTSFAIRSGAHTELNFTTTACEGVLPDDTDRQASKQTRELYAWYAKHYPAQAHQDGVDHC